MEFHFGTVEKCRRACAGGPGLRSRSYFGGVGSVGRPAAFSLLRGLKVLLGTPRPPRGLRPSLRAASGQDWTAFLNSPSSFVV